MPSLSRARLLALLLTPLAIAACPGESNRAVAVAAGDTSAARRSAAGVDSMLPIAEQVRRFRATLPARTDTLRGAAPSREALVRRWADALARFDTVALTAMVLDRGEFIDLYYPESPLSRAPYSMPPELLWFQLRNSGTDGGVKLRRLFGPGESRFRYVDHRCPDSAAVEGANRLWAGCTVRWRAVDGDTAEARLFGSILERDGRFKFVNYANKL